jgi:hypothetical protein
MSGARIDIVMGRKPFGRAAALAGENERGSGDRLSPFGDT